MAKVIKYQFLSCEVNHGTEENPVMDQIILEKHMECKTKEQYEANLLIAEKEAIEGTLDVTGEFDPEPDTATTDDVLNVMLGVM